MELQLDPSHRGLRSTRQPSVALKVAGVATSLLLHVLVVGFVVWSALYGGEVEEEPPQMLEFEDVELLALGEEKPPQQLPRKANPAPAPVEEDTVNLAEPEEEPEPEPEKEEKKEEPKPPQPDRKKQMLENLDDLNNPNRPTNTDTPEGDPDGVAGGTVSDKALANMMNTYQAQLMKSIAKYWRLPKSLSDAEINELTGKVVVYVRLSKEGHIIDYKFRQKSPNGQFNDSIERVLKRFQVSHGGRTLPMPDDTHVRSEVRRQGLNLRSWDPDG